VRRSAPEFSLSLVFVGWGSRTRYRSILDVLVKQGYIKEALAKYNEALTYPPDWKQLKEARKAAAKQKG
jgi:hypothetical protein